MLWISKLFVYVSLVVFRGFLLLFQLKQMPPSSHFLISISTEVGTTFACGSLEVGSLPGVVSVQSARAPWLWCGSWLWQEHGSCLNACWRLSPWWEAGLEKGELGPEVRRRFSPAQSPSPLRRGQALISRRWCRSTETESRLTQFPFKVCSAYTNTLGPRREQY